MAKKKAETETTGDVAVVEDTGEVLAEAEVPTREQVVAALLTEIIHKVARRNEDPAAEVALLLEQL